MRPYFSQLEARIVDQGFVIRKDLPAISAWSVKAAVLSAAQTNTGNGDSKASQDAEEAGSSEKVALEDNGAWLDNVSEWEAQSQSPAAHAEPILQAPSGNITAKQTTLMQAQMSQLLALKGVKGVQREGMMYVAAQHEAASSAAGRHLAQSDVCGTRDQAILMPYSSFTTTALPSPEVQPYGVSYVQANSPAAVQASKKLLSNVLFCIIDSGLDSTHPDLSGHVLSGAGSCYGPSCIDWRRDSMGHGTHVTGTVAALRNSLGVVGVTGSRSNIHMFNIFGPLNSFPESDFINAWESCNKRHDALRAANPQMRMVVSMSIGGPSGGSAVIGGYLDKLYRKGDVLLVAAAGNNGGTDLFFPASYGPVISVAAVDNGYQVAGFSQRNAQVELAAPGGSEEGAAWKGMTWRGMA